MRVLLLANLRSGRGRSVRLGREIQRRLTEAGHQTLLVDVCSPDGGAVSAAIGEGWHGVNGELAGADVVLTIGGDGTIHHLLPELISSGVPVYHVPGGNENLFAREFGMSASAAALASALERRNVAAVDLGAAGDRPFAIMTSVGPDAGVIHRLAAVRRRASGHAMYVSPMLQEMRRPHLPRLTVTVDGCGVVDGRCGLLVVANSRQYAARLNPASAADMRDGLLDALFLPAGTTGRLLLWTLRCALGEHLSHPDVVQARASEISVRCEQPAPWQADGEACGWIGAGEELVLRARPAALNVLMP